MFVLSEIQTLCDTLSNNIQPPKFKIMAFTAKEEEALLKARQEVVDKIVVRFAVERVVYLILTTLSCIGLFVLIIYYIFQGTINVKSALVLFGPTGVIALSVAGVLRMFDQVVKRVFTFK